MSQIHAHTASSVRRCPSFFRRSRVLKPDRQLSFSPVTPLDDKAQDFVEWWRRMHRRPHSWIAIKIKTVVFPDAKTGQLARFVWEVCKWPRWGGFDWVFVCWTIDRSGLWSKTFSTKREALAFFREPPEVVLQPSPDAGADGFGQPAPTSAPAAAPAS